MIVNSSDEMRLISRTAFYRGKRRFDEYGEAGLADRPRKPIAQAFSPNCIAGW